mgnify:CR=1 FL=1
MNIATPFQKDRLWCIAAALAAIAVAAGACAFLQHRRHLREERVAYASDGLFPGRFIKRYPGWLVYVHRREGPRLRTVTLYEWTPSRLKQMIQADSAVVRPRGAGQPPALELAHVYAYREGPGKPDCICVPDMVLDLASPDPSRDDPKEPR